MVKGDPCRCLNSLSDLPVLFCPLPYPVNSRCFGFPRISASSNRGVRWALPQPPHLRDGVETLKAVNWGKCRAYLALFPCCQRSLSLIAWCPVSCKRFSSYPSSIFWAVSVRRVYLPQVTSTWSEWESSTVHLGPSNSRHSIQCSPSHYLGLTTGNEYLVHCSTHRDRT